MNQIISSHKACIQQYLQRVMNIAATVTLTFFIARIARALLFLLVAFDNNLYSSSV